MRFVFSKEAAAEDDEDEESMKTCLRVFHTSCDISYNFCMQLLFDMFSTLMSDWTETESGNQKILIYGYNAGPPMAIPIHSTTTV